MKTTEIKKGRFYTDGLTVRLVMAFSFGGVDFVDLTSGESRVSEQRKEFAQWANCEVKPIWALMERCDGCDSDNVAFDYQGHSHCLDCEKKQPEGTGRVTKQ